MRPLRWRNLGHFSRQSPGYFPRAWEPRAGHGLQSQARSRSPGYSNAITRIRPTKTNCNLKREADPLATHVLPLYLLFGMLIAISSEKPILWLHKYSKSLDGGHGVIVHTSMVAMDKKRWVLIFAVSFVSFYHASAILGGKGMADKEHLTLLMSSHKPDKSRPHREALEAFPGPLVALRWESMRVEGSPVPPMMGAAP